ncbi:MAG: ComEA family DNA-binding protein [Lachnospiraceae bacterium]|nr:ComEA family DNA-binding protein [Lachnospiraceae bacterium]
MLIRRRFSKTDEKSGRRTRLLCLIFAVLAVSAAGACTSSRFASAGTTGIRIMTDPSEGLEDPPEDRAADDTEASPERGQGLFVYVCGQVRMPGVYELAEGSRVFEAVEAAGGMTEDAVPDGVNMAAVLRDADVIFIASRTETAGNNALDDSRININTAAASELTRLPGIGEKRASDIVAYREQNGAFRNTGDIMLIDGIGQALYEKIKDKICVSGF